MKMQKIIKPLLFVSLAFVGTGKAIAADGGCPTGQEGVSPFAAAKEQKGIVDVHNEAELPLAIETIHAPGWRFRARTITVAPGAVIPLHSHNDRPETVTMKSGELTVYESDCKVPYVMKEGQIYQSGHGKSHWVTNLAEHYAVMYVVDLVKNDTFPVKDGTHPK